VATLNIIGCGRVGRALAQLLGTSGAFGIGDVFDRTREKSAAAVAFIGSGRAVGAIADMHAARVWMLTPRDDRIAACCAALAQSGLLKSGDIVFHCSGALPSEELAAVRARGASIASVHPLKSFAEPAAAARTFGGTSCDVEGDAAALAVLKPAFEAIGARLFEIDPRAKVVYHASSVIVCNLLTALIEAGVRGYEKAGFKRDDALRVMEPLVREGLDQTFRLGPARALTGPIARGDHAVVKRELEALDAWNPQIAAVYRQLGAIAVELARAQGKADRDEFAAIARLLSREERTEP